MTHSLTVADIATLVGGTVDGDATLAVTGVESLDRASATDVSFLGNPTYRSQVLPSRAGGVLVPLEFDVPVPAGRAWIRCADPSVAFMRVVERFTPPPPYHAPGRHPSAVVDASAQIAATAHLGPCVVVAAGATVGERSVILAGTFIGESAVVGSDCLIYPNVTLRERCRLGDRVVVHSGTTIGSDGFGYIPNRSGGLHTKIPQVGIVQIDDDVEIGANVAIDRARFGRTWIRRGVKIDNLVQIAHNVEIGELSFIIAQAGIAGSSRIGRGCAVWAQAGVAGHLTVGDGAQILAQSGIAKDVEPGEQLIGSPGVTRKDFVRQLRAADNVAKLAERVKALEARLGQTALG